MANHDGMERRRLTESITTNRSMSTLIDAAGLRALSLPYLSWARIGFAFGTSYLYLGVWAVSCMRGSTC